MTGHGLWAADRLCARRTAGGERPRRVAADRFARGEKISEIARDLRVAEGPVRPWRRSGGTAACGAPVPARPGFGARVSGGWPGLPCGTAGGHGSGWVELCAGGAAGVGGAAQEPGDELEVVAGIVGADLRELGVHPGSEPQDVRAAAGYRLEDDAAAVGRIALAQDPAAALEAVDDAGHGGGVEAGQPGQRARAERAVPVDEIKALQVGALEVEMPADALVEQGQLDAQVAQRLPDGPVQRAPAISLPAARR